MGVVRGAISIRDNMSAVLRSVRQEQSAFRRDVERTRRELQATWERRRTARLDATPANRAAQRLRQRLEPLRKKIVTAVAIKDMATAKLKSVTNKIKAAGKMAAAPVIRLTRQCYTIYFACEDFLFRRKIGDVQFLHRLLH